MIDDQMLIQAVRERLMDELKKKSDAQSIVNNVYGSPMAGGQGIMGALGGEGGQDSPDPRGDDADYFVDIMRENLDPENPGAGWKKKVHRYKKKAVTT